MGLIRVWQLGFAVLLFAGANAWAGVGEIWGPEQASAQLDLITEVLKAAPSGRDALLEEMGEQVALASRALKEGKLAQARGYLARGVLMSGVPIERIIADIRSQRSSSFEVRRHAIHRAVALAPEHLSQRLRRSVMGLQMLLHRLADQERGSRDTLGVLSLRRNASLDRSVLLLDRGLDRLGEKLDPQNLQSMAGFVLRGADFVLLYSSCLEALLLRHESTELRAELFVEAVEHYGVKGYFRVDPSRMARAYDMDRTEEDLRANVNRETVMAATAATALVVEILFYPFGGGVGLPPTFIALGRTLQVGTSTLYMAGPALNISDRALGRGDYPLWSRRTLTDTLLIMGAAPLRLLKVAQASRFYRLWLGVRTVKGISIYSFFLIRTLDRLGDLFNAEQVALERQKRGDPVTAADVRRETIAVLLAYAVWIRGLSSSTAELKADLRQAAAVR